MKGDSKDGCGPPAGAIKIDKEGAWYYNGLPIINATIHRLFSGHVENDGQGGYQLHIDGERVPLEVEDTPYVVAGIRESADPDIGFVVRLNDTTEEPFALDTLCIGAAGVPYCRVKSGRFPARLLRPAWNTLAPHITHDEEAGRFYILQGARRHYLPTD